MTLLNKLDRAEGGDENSQTIIKYDTKHPEYPCSDGTQMLLQHNDILYIGSLSTPFDITTLTVNTTNILDLDTIATRLWGPLWVDSNFTVCYIATGLTNEIYKFDIV